MALCREWLDKVKAWVLPCNYWHIVFTLPHEFNDLVAANRKAIYGLVFLCGTQAMLRIAEECWGLVPSIASTLHTWGQLLLRHIHSHNVVSCGGLTKDGKWVDIAPDDKRFSGPVLAERFRSIFLAELRKLFIKGELKLPSEMVFIWFPDEFDAWLAPIAAKDWNVMVKQSTAGSSGPSVAIQYLANYVAGMAIGDSRILDDDGKQVTFSAKDYRKDGAVETPKIDGVEFVYRLALHIMPPYCRRVRYAGLLSLRKREKLLATCRELLKDRLPPDTVPPSVPVNAEGEDEQDDETGDDVAADPVEWESKPLKKCLRCGSTDLEYIEYYWPHQHTWRIPSRVPPCKQSSVSAQLQFAFAAGTYHPP